MTLDILLVDDEALARSAVRRQIQALLPEATVREARDGFEALDRIREQRPDLLFLDVEMPELSGLDLLRQLPPPRPRVVFVTAFEHFAVRAFDEHACDYVVKPFTPERLQKAVARALESIDTEVRLRSLEGALQTAGHRLDRLALRRGTGFDAVAPDAVVCLVSEDHYTHLYADSHVYLSELSLQHFEEQLDPAVFARAHRNALVNVRHVARLGHETVVLDNGMELAVSRRSRGPLLAMLQG